MANTYGERIEALEKAMKKLKKAVKSLEDDLERLSDISTCDPIGFEYDFPDPDDFDPDESEY